jgi:hypothetical protein
VDLKLRAIIVDIHQGSTRESWIEINPDGAIIYHSENDGARCLRRGLEARDETLTFEQVTNRFTEEVVKHIKEALTDFAAGRQPVDLPWERGSPSRSR